MARRVREVYDSYKISNLQEKSLMKDGFVHVLRDGKKITVYPWNVAIPGWVAIKSDLSFETRNRLKMTWVTEKYIYVLRKGHVYSDKYESTGRDVYDAFPQHAFVKLWKESAAHYKVLLPEYSIPKDSHNTPIDGRKLKYKEHSFVEFKQAWNFAVRYMRKNIAR